MLFRSKVFSTTVYRQLKEYKCSCKLFEFRGILCKHIIKVIDSCEEVQELPEKYVLKRWRKNIVREYEHVKVSYYDPNDNVRVKKFRDLSVKHDYLISLALHNEQAYEEYVEGLNKLEKKLEANLGIMCSDEQKEMEINGKVFGRRRVQRKSDKDKKDCTRQGISSEDPVLKDPNIVKPKGRPRSTRFKNPAEGPNKKKQKIKTTHKVRVILMYLYTFTVVII